MSITSRVAHYYLKHRASRCPSGKGAQMKVMRAGPAGFGEATPSALGVASRLTDSLPLHRQLQLHARH